MAAPTPTPVIQKLKAFVRDQLGVPPVVVLVAVGLFAHIALNFALKKPFTSPWGLLAPVTLGCAIEAWEIWVQYSEIGLTASGNDPVVVILARHALDVIVMVAAPVLLVGIGAIPSRS